MKILTINLKLLYVILASMVISFIACKTDNPVDSYSANKSDISAYNLIDPSQASAMLDDNSGLYLPIQVSKREVFLKEHIPTAQNIWRPDYGSDQTVPYGGLIPSRDKLEKLLQKLGFSEGKTLVLYDVKANVDALRFAWVLNLYGFDDFKLINGGLKYWKEVGYDVTTEELTPIRSDYQLKDSFNDSMIAYYDEVLAAIDDPNTILIDTRENYEYRGEPFISNGVAYDYKKGAFNRGSIPSAVHLNWSNLADLNGDHRIKAESDLSYDLMNQGIEPDKNIILYCQSGSRTSHMYYVLKHVLGYEKVKNYDGSWLEWSYKNSVDRSVPILQLCSEDRFMTMKDSLTEVLASE